MQKWLFIFCLLLFSFAAQAQNRFALVIGNQAYPPRQDKLNDLGPLDNPRNDASDMADLLQQHGFTLVDHQGRDRPLLDASKARMDDAVDRLLAKARSQPDSEIWFYFSGHGVYLQDLKRPAESANYLLPVGVNFSAEDPAKIKAYAVNAHNIKERIESVGQAAKLMIIDACRDKLTLKQSKGFLGGGEFRPMNPTNGMMVVHATLHSYKAWGDDSARNSRFTAKLLDALRGNRHESLALVIGQAIQAVTRENQNYPAAYRQQPMPEGLFFSKVCLGECLAALGAADFPVSRTAAPAAQFFRDRLRAGGEGPEMARIPAGRFRMGDIQGGGHSDEKPVHEVAVGAFAIGRYEVTFAEYDRFAEATGREKPDDRGWGRGQRPVINVSWLDAVAYTEWLSQQTGQDYRLPTEAEWEYAARAGTETKYWWGNIASHDNANYGQDDCCGGLAQGKDKWEYTAPVGSFAANPFGLHDTTGNVWEWVQDWYANDYYRQSSVQNPTGPETGSSRVLRGGSWGDLPEYCRVAERYSLLPDSRDGLIGFRVVRVAPRT